MVPSYPDDKKKEHTRIKIVELSKSIWPNMLWNNEIYSVDRTFCSSQLQSCWANKVWVKEDNISIASTFDCTTIFGDGPIRQVFDTVLTDFVHRPPK